MNIEKFNSLLRFIKLMEWENYGIIPLLLHNGYLFRNRKCVVKTIQKIYGQFK